MNPPLAEDVFQALRASRKYRHCHAGMLRRTARWAVERHAAPKEAVKAAKRKLHQVHGVFFEGVDFKVIDDELDAIARGGGDDALRESCTRILRSHPSTAERLPHIEGFFAPLFEGLPEPVTVLDVGCGLAPFALPWMPRGRIAAYTAIDVDERLTDRLNRFFGLLNLPAAARTADIITDPPGETADLAFLFKLIPTLEQERPGFSLELLRSLRVKRFAVSFPRKTLGGRNVAMDRHYGTVMSELLEKLRLPAVDRTIPGEWIIVINTG